MNKKIFLYTFLSILLNCFLITDFSLATPTPTPEAIGSNLTLYKYNTECEHARSILNETLKTNGNYASFDEWLRKNPTKEERKNWSKQYLIKKDRYLLEQRGLVVPNNLINQTIDTVYIYFHGMSWWGYSIDSICNNFKVCQNTLRMNTAGEKAITILNLNLNSGTTSQTLRESETSCLLNEAQQILSQLNINSWGAKLGVAGHSGGGRFVQNVVQSTIKVHYAIFLDSCYANWCEDAVKNKGVNFFIYSKLNGDELTHGRAALKINPNINVAEVSTSHDGITQFCFGEHIDKNKCSGKATFLNNTNTFDTSSGLKSAGTAVASSVDTVTSISEIKQILLKPTTKINIPGLNFSDPKTGQEDGSTYVYIPFIGEYLSAIYKWFIGALGIFAVVRLMQAGFGWLMSGGSAELITVERKKIQNAIIGLTLAIGSYALLYTINPHLVEFRNLKILYIKGEEIYDSEPTFAESGTTASPPTATTPGSSTVTSYKRMNYKQSDTRWANVPFDCAGTGKKGEETYNIYFNGCPFVSLVNVLNSFYENAGDPGVLLPWFHSNSAIGFDCTIKSGLNPEITKQKWFQDKFPGLTSKVMSKPYTVEKIKKELNEGKIMVMCSNASALTTSQHCYTVYGYHEKEGKIYLDVDDPGTNYGRCTVDITGSDLEADAKIKKKMKDCRGSNHLEKCKNCGGTEIFDQKNYPLEYILKTLYNAIIFSSPTAKATSSKSPAATSNKCSFKESRWNKQTGSSEIFRTVKNESYTEIIASDPNYVSKIDPRCSVCEEDQVNIDINGQSTKICWAYAEQVTKILNEATNNGYQIKTLVGYRPLRSAGDTDEQGFYIGVGGHFYGMAIDINSSDNGLYNNCKSWDYTNKPKGPLPNTCTLSAGGAWNPITKPNSSIYPGSFIHGAFISSGWKWGGTDMGSQRDMMDFSIYGYNFSITK